MNITRLEAAAAADPRRSAWVSANAGAGKTHTLANRVTRLLLEEAKPQRILCLTYTKSAAAEMQSRLFERLGQWAMFDDEKLRAAIVEIGAHTPDSEGLRRARRLFALALETPGGLKIQTIHSFCERLLGRFAIEAEVPPSFKVLDEQTARELIAEARTHVLERAGSGDGALAAAVGHIVTETSENRLHLILDAVLGNDRRRLERFFSTLPTGQDALRRVAELAHGVKTGESIETIASGFCEEAKQQAETLAAAILWLEGGGANDRKLADRLAAFSARDFGTEAFGSLRAAFCKSDGVPKEKLVTKALCETHPKLAGYVGALATRYVVAEQRCRAARTALLAHAALTLADAVRRVYTSAKRARGSLDYHDLISETLKLLERSDAAAWVLYKLDGGLDHILIDEAQDTSPEQWRIVRHLADEFFAGSGSRDLLSTPRTVFAVGDQKQSIFSFQGADPEEFEINRQHFAEHAGKDFSDVPLQTSRRSAPEILRFVDEVFANPLAREGLTSSNARIKHHAYRKDAKGRVELWPTIKAVKTPEVDYWRRPVNIEPETSPVVRLADKVATEIRQWLENRVRLPGHTEPIRAGDIMILMPRREPFATEIIRKLTQRGVPVAGADRIRLKNEIAVMDLIALGRFALLPEDDLNLAALLRSPLIGIAEEELFALAHGRQGRLWRQLREAKETDLSFALAYDFLYAARSRADRVPPYEFFAEVLNARDMRSRILARLGPEANDALEEFQSLTLEYEGVGTPSLQGFLHWIERGDAEVKRDMERGRDQVRVMTVHGAKGLEADIVFLPDTTALPDPPGMRGELLFSEDGVIFPIRKADACEAVTRAKDLAKEEALKEYRRLFYVALTRAKDRLYVCGFEGKPGMREGCWYKLARAAMENIGRKIETSSGDMYVLGDDKDDSAERVQAAAIETGLPNWASIVPPPEHHQPRLLRPSEMGAEDIAVASPVGPEQAKRFRRGLLIHALLSRLPEIGAGERRTISLAFLAAQNVSPAEIGPLTDATLRVLDDPQFAEAFAPGSKGEVAIVADLPELGEGARVSGRIDRLTVSDGEVLAVDFKTNRPPPQRVDDLPHIYLRQMALYRAALAKLFPTRQIKCALVWTEGPRLMPLPADLLDREIAAFQMA